jgi:hypothetical protein
VTATALRKTAGTFRWCASLGFNNATTPADCEGTMRVVLCSGFDGISALSIGEAAETAPRRG